MDESPANEATIILIASTALLLLLVFTLVIVVLFQQKRKHQHRQQLAEIQNQNEQALLKSKLKIQEDTFLAISQNLHDNVGSNISTAMLLLYKDQHTASEEEEINRKDALSMLGVIVDDLKDISRSLNSGYLEEIGLNEAVRHRIALLVRLKKYEIELHLDDMPGRLDRQKQLFLFYIFQEAINNINKHARAKKISVRLSYDKNKMIMHISDDGAGIARLQHGEMYEKGSGLINMNNHAGMIGAVLDIQSEAGKGTGITVTIPDPYI